MAWKTVGGVKGDLQKWEEPGTTVEGVFKGTWAGQHGPLGAVDTQDGRTLTFPVPTALQTQLQTVQAGQLVRLTYLGTVKSGAGRDYKNFSTELWTPEDEGQQLPLEQGPGDPEEDAPF